MKSLLFALSLFVTTTAFAGVDKYLKVLEDGPEHDRQLTNFVRARLSVALKESENSAETYSKTKKSVLKPEFLSTCSAPVILRCVKAIRIFEEEEKIPSPDLDLISKALRASADNVLRYLPMANKGTPIDQELIELVRLGMSCLVMKGTSLDTPLSPKMRPRKSKVDYTGTPGSERSDPFSSKITKDSLTEEAEIELSEKVSDYKSKRKDVFSEDITPYYSVYTLTHCVQAIGKFQEDRGICSNELQTLAGTLTTIKISIERAPERLNPHDDTSHEVDLGNFIALIEKLEGKGKGLLDKCKVSPDRKTATRSSTDLRVNLTASASSLDVLPRGSLTRSSTKKDDEDHYDVECYLELKESVLDPKYLKQCNIGTLLTAFNKLMPFFREEPCTQEVIGVSQKLLDGFIVACTQSAQFTVGMMKLILKDETLLETKAKKFLNFDSWAQYIIEHKINVGQDDEENKDFGEDNELAQIVRDYKKRQDPKDKPVTPLARDSEKKLNPVVGKVLRRLSGKKDESKK